MRNDAVSRKGRKIFIHNFHRPTYLSLHESTLLKGGHTVSVIVEDDIPVVNL